MNTRTKTKQRWGRGTLAILAAVLAVLVVGGGVALATIPGGGGAINGCYNKSSGALRVIDSTVASCSNGESAISWNQTGPQGLPGAQGAAGPKGDKGDKGDQGPAGPTGQQGPKGDAGDQGTAGPQGPKGDAGPQGPEGQAGPQGPVGPAGSGGVSGRQVAMDGKTVWPLSTETAVATCSDGKVPVGGGVSTQGLVTGDGIITDSYPTSDGWYGRVNNPGADLFVQMYVYAICVDA